MTRGKANSPPYTPFVECRAEHRPGRILLEADVRREDRAPGRQRPPARSLAEIELQFVDPGGERVTRADRLGPEGRAEGGDRCSNDGEHSQERGVPESSHASSSRAAVSNAARLTGDTGRVLGPGACLFWPTGTSTRRSLHRRATGTHDLPAPEGATGSHGSPGRTHRITPSLTRATRSRLTEESLSDTPVC
ncbi:hypothetical protein RCH22_001419 [Cryobacterium psychrotolerans]|nr:hypothetical protein [Cryobacterium psychrotolerans]